MIPRLAPRAWRASPVPDAAPWKIAPTALPVSAPRGREHPRASVRSEIWIGRDGIFTRTPGELRDLSEGGAFVKTAQPFPIGSVLQLRFQLPDPPRYIDGTVAVRHFQTGVGMGVQFVDLSEDNRRHVRHFIDRFGGYASPL